MIQHYKKVKIKKLKIEKEFDYRSSDKFIIIDPEGDVNTSIQKINLLRRISNLENILTISESNYKLCNILNIRDTDRVNWEFLIGKSICRDYTKYLLSEIRHASGFITSYHTEILPQRIKLYENLTSVIGPDGHQLETPIYSHSSVSGRTTITQGHNFLTSTKEFRKSCKSINSDHLVSIDFKSCEPNLYLRAIGKEIKNSDVYNHLMTELDIKVDNRSQLKRGILSVLYGASDETARRILGGDNKTLAKIKTFFEIEETTNKLREEFDREGFIFNMYGRPIFSDKSILNKWIQSSAVDFCSLAFLKFARDNNLSVSYLIHDDMVVNCSESEYQSIKETKTLQDPCSKISLPVEISIIS